MMKREDIDLAIRVSCLLSYVNSTPLNNQDHHVHTLLVGPPGSGKTRLCRLVAEIVHRGAFLDGSKTSMEDLAYAKASINGKPAVSAGALLSNLLVVVDDATSMPHETLDELKTVIESQTAVYEMPFNHKTEIDVSMILTCNPDASIWDPDLSIVENLQPFRLSFLSHFNIFLTATETDTRESIENVFNDMRGIIHDSGDKLTHKQLSAYLAHARTLKPNLTQECSNVLTEWLDTKSNKDVVNEARVLYGNRLPICLMRNAGAIAKLLVRDKVDAECATLATWLLEASFASLGVDSSFTDDSSVYRRYVH